MQLKLSSRISYKEANQRKLDLLNVYVQEHRRVANLFIDALFSHTDNTRLPTKLHNEHEEIVDGQTQLTARAIQAAYQDAASIMNATKAKQSKRQFIYNKLLSSGHPARAAKLKVRIDRNNLTKPTANDLDPVLDSRFVKLETATTANKFDAWITISSLWAGSKSKAAIAARNIILPVKFNKHFNKFNNSNSNVRGSSLKFCKNNLVQVSFDVYCAPQKTYGNTIGVDLGIKKLFVASDGQQATPDGKHDMLSICKNMTKLKRGSNAYLRAQRHRKNYIGQAINRLVLTNVMKVYRENLKQLKGCSGFTAKLNHSVVGEKLERHCNLLGVQVDTVSPAYTSQRCPHCSWTQKSNRRGELFKCKRCGYAVDADLNGATNISLCLPPISAALRRRGYNRQGFVYCSYDEKRAVTNSGDVIVRFCQQNKTVMKMIQP